MALRPWLSRLLRPFGLRVLTTLIDREEPRKTVVYDSIWAVIVRYTIHLIPSVVTVFLAVFNIGGFFIGRTLQGPQGHDDIKDGAIQIAAKIQELFVLSSLGSIILHMLRERLLFGDGVPFGLLGSDKAFSQVSFFWSIDFLGGLVSYVRKVKSRYHFCEGFLLVLVLVYGGILALMTGPATAILMIPRKLETPVGGAKFQLNRTTAELWPSILDASYGDASICATAEQQLSNPECPSSGFTTLSRVFNRSFGPTLYLQFDVNDDYLRKSISAESNNDGLEDTWVYTTHGPTAEFQDAVVDSYTTALLYLRENSPRDPWYARPSNLDLAQTRRYQVETQIPLVRTICEVQPTMTRNNVTSEFSFAKFDQFGIQRIDWETAQKVHTGTMQDFDVFDDLQRSLGQRNITLTRDSNLVDAMDGLDHVVVPVELPSHLNASLAMVYLRRATNIPKQDQGLAALNPFHVMTCTVEARWVQGRSIQTYESFQNTLQPHGRKRDVTSTLVEPKLGLDSLDREDGLVNSELAYLPDIDRGNIQIHADWFDAMMSPFIHDTELPGYPALPSQPNRTTTERMLETREIPNWIGEDQTHHMLQRSEVEVVIGSMFADSLSRSGSDSPDNFKGIIADDAKEPGEESSSVASSRKLVHRGAPTQTFHYIDFPSEGRNISDMPILTQEAIFTGYAIAATNRYDWFCIVLLLSHALLALGHTSYCLISYCVTSRGLHCRSHDTWDTIPQLVALSQQSRPAREDVLSNVCGGIQSFRTAGTVATVEYSKDTAPIGGVSEELQLVIRDYFRHQATVLRRTGRGFQPGHYAGMPMAGRSYGLKED